MTAPGVSAPDGAYVVGSRYGQDVPHTEDGVKSLIRGQQLDPWTAAQNAFMTIFKGPLEVLQGAVAVVQGIVSGIESAIDTIFGRVDDHDTELAGLQSSTQKLEGVIGYGHAYSTASISLSLGSVRYGMTNTIGPTVGGTWPNGAFYMGSKGLWMADAQVTLDGYLVGSQDVELGIKVFAPNGSLHAQRYSRFKTGETVTLAVHMPFTIPSAGYYAELWVNAAIGRGIFGGSAWNGLSVSKISTETS